MGPNCKPKEKRYLIKLAGLVVGQNKSILLLSNNKYLNVKFQYKISYLAQIT